MSTRCHNSNQLLLTSPSIIMSLQSLRTLARPVATRSFATSATLLNSSTKAPTTTESNAGIVPDAPVRDANGTYSGTIHAVSDVVRLVAELHQPLVVAGAAATASATAIGAKLGSALGEAVTEWFKARIEGRSEVKATIPAPDGSVLKEIKG